MDLHFSHIFDINVSIGVPLGHMAYDYSVHDLPTHMCTTGQVALSLVYILSYAMLNEQGRTPTTIEHRTYRLSYEFASAIFRTLKHK
jgi:hypothetical protein